MRALSRSTVCFAYIELSVFDLTQQGFPQAEVEKAIADMDRARDRGFMWCLAVFVNYEYDGLWERASENDGYLDWGRGQDVTKRNFFRDGKVVPDPEWKPDPPVAEWTAHGLTCRVRENGIGYLCGYVAVPEDHPWHGKDYGQCTKAEPCDESYCDHRIEHIVDVHGGVTYADAMHDGGWWIGFDCAHWGDAPSPERRARDARERGGEGLYHSDDHYWTVGEVRAETERMAEQVAGIHAHTGPVANVTKLHVAPELALPPEVVTEKLAFLGRTGSGKTYAALKLAEEMARVHAQFVALDLCAGTMLFPPGLA